MTQTELENRDTELRPPPPRSEIPPPPRVPSLRAERIRSWGPTLTGVAAIIAALATLQSGLVRAQTDLSPVLRDIAGLREELRLRDSEAQQLRRRVGDLEDSAARERTEIARLRALHEP